MLLQTDVEVLFQDQPIDFAERALDGHRLADDALTVSPAFDHHRYAVQMAFGAVQAAYEIGLELGRITRHWLSLPYWALGLLAT
jgi:hypothetical protein